MIPAVSLPLVLSKPCTVSCPHLVTIVMWEGLGIAFPCRLCYLSWYQLCTLLCSVEGISKPVQHQHLPSGQLATATLHPPFVVIAQMIFFWKSTFIDFFTPFLGKNFERKLFFEAQIENIVPTQVLRVLQSSIILLCTSHQVSTWYAGLGRAGQRVWTC